MDSNHQDTTEPTDNIKFSQLQAAFKKNLDEPYFEEIIKSNFNINHKVSGITALHLAFDHKQIKIFNLFLRHGANILMHNNGCTVLHKAFQEAYEEKTNTLKSTVLPFIQSALTAYADLKSQDLKLNPVNKHGISHFHVACAVNHTKAVEKLLSKDVPVDQAIHSASPVLPGFTSLHLAVKYYSLETVQLLLKHKADLNLKEKSGLTPLQLLAHRKLELNSLVNNGKIALNGDVKKELDASDKIMCLLLEHETADAFYPYAVCTLTNSSLAEKLLQPVINFDCPVNSKTPLWQGYTMLHFAAHCNFDTLLLLLTRGASMEAKDPKGVTPFDLCLSRCNAENIHSLIANYASWKNINLSDRKTKLRDVVFAMRDPNEFKSLLQNLKTNINKLHVPDFSPLWPGSTLLHLAVYFTNHNHLFLVEECLNRGADVTVKDTRGWTPVHLAFRHKRIRTVNLLLQHQNSQDNPIDEDNLSYLHVACAVRNEALVKKLLDNSADLETAYKGQPFTNLVKKGATPIHAAVAGGSCEIVAMLLSKGANLYALDDAMLTPIHRMMLGKNVKTMGTVLLSQPDLRDCPMPAIGMNYLHAACYVDHVDAAKRMLDLGVDIDSRVLYMRSSFFKFLGFSPLHLAVENGCKEVARMLLDHGADMLAKKDANSTSLLYEILSGRNVDFYDVFVSTLRNNYACQKRMTRDCGMTMLHVACHSLDFDFVKHLLHVGVKVDAQIAHVSKIWPGCTPLHVLAKRNEFSRGTAEDADDKIDQMLKLLLDGGADVTIVDADRKTPVHLFLESLAHVDEARNPGNCDRLSQLLKAQKDFKVNPADRNGISHFHVACLINEVSVVKDFLESGLDVNQPIDSGSSHVSAGCTALQLSSRGSDVESMNDFSNQRKTVDLLLKYGADVRARDPCGNTPLHSAAEVGFMKDVEIFDKLVRAGSDIFATNIRKETPLECLLRTETANTDSLLNIFIKNGYRLNTFNAITEEGIVGQFYHHSIMILISLFEIFERTPPVLEVDEMGRTLIHNAVSVAPKEGIFYEHDYFERVTGRLVRLGCDIDVRDSSGKTALHYAIKFHNIHAVVGLLNNGADINVADFDGSAAFVYSLKLCGICKASRHSLISSANITSTLLTHVMKLVACGLEARVINQFIPVETPSNTRQRLAIDQTFYDELNEAKRVKIGSSSFFVHDFLSETGAVAAYPSIPQLQRVEINEFFESLDDRFLETKCLLRLQHKKALMRWKLNVDATRALRSLLQFSLPEVCCWMIFRYLGNSNLTNLIKSMVEVESENMRMCVD